MYNSWLVVEWLTFEIVLLESIVTVAFVLFANEYRKLYICKRIFA